MMKQKGITLIALVITIIVLIILAGVTINTLVGEEGLIEKTKQAKAKTEEAKRKEEHQLEEVLGRVEEEIGESYSKEKGVNKPRLTTGMTPIKFTEPTESIKGVSQLTESTDKDWYNYEQKKWANVQTEDGSMWVWIPRYAYRVDASSKTFDIVFLIGNTDQYYDTEGNMQTAKRCNHIDEYMDTTTGYTVHPAFTDETAISYRNGGWDKELTGIWVAKFEAGYASGNNNAPIKASSVSYSQSTSYVKTVESGKDADGSELARNWLDGIYGTTKTAIKYPTFQGKTYGLNYINYNDSFELAKKMTEDGNIYGLTQQVDSHLMKNSEWGAVAYLSQSKYGLNGTDIAINNISLNSGGTERTNVAGKSGVDSVYAITGCTTGTNNATEKITTITNINNTVANTAIEGVYTWEQLNGTKASSTGTIYGIYDLSGGGHEKMASYVKNGNTNLKTYGASITYDGNNLKTVSTKYITVYPFDNNTDNTDIEFNTQNFNIASANNYKKNVTIYGDGILEISKEGIGNTAWYEDLSKYPSLHYPFWIRGGRLRDASYSGLFAFRYHYGNSTYADTLRAVLILE